MSLITADLLIRAGASPSGAALYAGPLAASCDSRFVSGKTSITALLANILNESAGLMQVVENCDYSSAAYILKVFPSHFASTAEAQACVRNPAALAAKVYGNCQGRGLGMLTGVDNYAAYAKAARVNLVDVAAYLETPQGAADSAVWFYAWRGCQAYADRGDLLNVVRLWEGGQNPIGWTAVQRWHGQVSRALAGGSTVPGPVSSAPTTDDLNAASLAGTLNIESV